MFAESIDAYVAKRASVREPDGKWHASSLFYCDRQAVYERLGVTPSDEKDGRSYRTLYLGTLLHGLVQEALVEYLDAGTGGEHVFIEVPVAMPELDFVSTADGLVWRPAEDRWAVVEYKTISAWGFRKPLPQEPHVKQARAYALGLRRHGSPERGIPPLGDKLDRGVVIYISKDNLDLRLCWFDISVAEEERIEEMIGRLSVLARHRMVPARLPVGSDGKRAWSCGYCRFQTRCWDLDPEEGDLVPAGKLPEARSVDPSDTHGGSGLAPAA